MKKIFRIWALAILGLGIHFPTSAENSTKNLAYNDAYVWHLADRLATLYAMRHGFSKLEPDHSHQFLFEISLEYHHRMIACDGPLPLIAPRLKSVLEPTIPARPPHEHLLSILGSTDYDVWPIVLNWALGLEAEVNKKFRDGKITTEFPTCLVPGYEMPQIGK